MITTSSIATIVSVKLMCHMSMLVVVHVTEILNKFQCGKFKVINSVIKGNTLGYVNFNTSSNLFFSFHISTYHSKPVMWYAIILNTLRPRPNGRHFADEIFKYIFLNENAWIAIKISLKFVPEGFINNIPSLVQTMAWHRQATSRYLNQWWLVYWRINASLGLNELIVETWAVIWSMGSGVLTLWMPCFILSCICTKRYGLLINDLHERSNVLVWWSTAGPFLWHFFSPVIYWKSNCAPTSLFSQTWILYPSGIGLHPFDDLGFTRRHQLQGQEKILCHVLTGLCVAGLRGTLLLPLKTASYGCICRSMLLITRMSKFGHRKW